MFRWHLRWKLVHRFVIRKPEWWIEIERVPHSWYSISLNDICTGRTCGWIIPYKFFVRPRPHETSKLHILFISHLSNAFCSYDDNKIICNKFGLARSCWISKSSLNADIHTCTLHISHISLTQGLWICDRWCLMRVIYLNRIAK